MDKFKTEVDMCEEVTQLIVGGLIDTETHYFQTIPEAPKAHFSNDHVDMLIIDRETRQYLMIEYKLSDAKGLANQLAFPIIGVINSIPRKPYHNMFPYDGSDRLLEILLRATRQKNINSHWQPIYGGWGMVYWWGYHGVESSLKGGTGFGEKRPTFHHLYIQAIVSLQNAYEWKLGRDEVLAIFSGIGYGESTMIKHYRTALKSRPIELPSEKERKDERR